NILTNPLCVLAPLLSARLATASQAHAGGGCLGLSGVLESQADDVIAAYAPFLKLHVAATLDGWVLLEGQRQRQAP
ncbi:MAG: 50S ribosomal protein L11 methyltransferase, partial [Sterolibacterium sp.]